MLLAKLMAVAALLGASSPAAHAEKPDLMAALFSGRPEKIKQALDQGADVNTKDRLGTTALHAAAFAGNSDAVKLLLEKGAHLDAKDRYGNTPLVVALAAPGPGSDDVAKILVEKGADVNAKTEGYSVLSLAVYGGKGDLARMF